MLGLFQQAGESMEVEMLLRYHLAKGSQIDQEKLSDNASSIKDFLRFLMSRNGGMKDESLFAADLCLVDPMCCPLSKLDSSLSDDRSASFAK